MARNLYRVYLYVVMLVMLAFAAVGIVMLLSTLLAQTSLGSIYNSVPTQQDIVQQFVFAAVALVIAGALGGLHYWLIRRDMRSDPVAGSGAVRSFFLNGAEALAALITVAAGASALSGLGTNFPLQFDASGPVAGAIVAFAVFVLLELERRRTRAAQGRATTFQRLHLFGVPLVLVVVYGTNFVLTAVQQTVSAVLNASGQLPLCSAGNVKTPSGACYMGPRLDLLWGAALLVVAAWIGYSLFARDDVHSSIRQVTHVLGFGFGAIFTLIGIERVVELGFRALLGVPFAWSDIVSSYDVGGSLVFGLATALAYGLWLRRESAGLPMGAETTRLIVLAISGIILAVPFWFGVGRVLSNGAESVAAAGFQPTQADWAAAFALVITGIAYIPVELSLRTRSLRSGNMGPRRGFVFALLASGALTGAIGAVAILYAVITNLLQAPVADWQHIARLGAVALIVGAVLAGIYSWQAVHEGFFKRPAPKQPELATVAPPAPSEPPDSVESVLDAYAAGNVTREAAANRIHQIEHRQPVPVA